ncbi:PREDICTED: hemolymph lipopolysaccharide-binding protein-like [Dufourea novaeangliae]|uniref:Hemolymph lipopolysaccharide-binding protein n=1 Tax=Dufourea novaeangliae TaxID=178035 RepID=A0A154PGG5_DUFNO|nr:PREDICTED: hemolymph lipopolysaccharide-binding protein-like [Dufourea novaeangliae]KZC10280.1 Hemolymph lipopolysaccharide-binding protein [Dufourea novaeangliae]
MSLLNVLVSYLIPVVCVPVTFAVPQFYDMTDSPQFATLNTEATTYHDNLDLDVQNETTNICHCPNADLTLNHNDNSNVVVRSIISHYDLMERKPPMRDDYVYTPGIGAHKLHTRAKTWNNARKSCKEEGAHLAIVNSKSEARVLTGIFNRIGLIIGTDHPDHAFLGIHDCYAEGDWVTILDDSLAEAGYTDWSNKWGGQPDNGGGGQNCGILLKDGTLDDFHCQTPLPYFCELPC